MDQKSNAFLETESVGKLMTKYSVPCVISLLVAALYNIVDQIFISNADYLGSYGNAANTVVFPLTIVALAIAVMIATAAAPLSVSAWAPTGRTTPTKSISSAVLLCIISSLVITVIYLIFQDPILTAFGGRVNERTFADPRSISSGLPWACPSICSARP